MSGRVKASAGGTKRSIVCHECGQRIVATIQQAKRHEWLLWVGGALCPRHHDRENAAGTGEIHEGAK